MNPPHKNRIPASPYDWLTHARSDIKLDRTPYAVETRYPGYWGEISETDISEAAQFALDLRSPLVYK